MRTARRLTATPQQMGYADIHIAKQFLLQQAPVLFQLCLCSKVCTYATCKDKPTIPVTHSPKVEELL